jgi:hypothetical protein
MAIPEVRALIPDLDTTNQIFTDAEITLYLSVAKDSNLRAAGLALLAIATNEALLKKLHTDDFGVDGPAGADSIRKNAAAYFAEADRLDAAGADEATLIVFPETDDCFCVPEASPRWGCF